MTGDHTIHYNKLVRDRIPEIIEKEGKIAKIDFAKDDNLYLDLLSKKLVEESQEFALNKDDNELADILEVLLAILHFKKLSFTGLEKIRLKKNAERGGFQKRIILLSTNESK